MSRFENEQEKDVITLHTVDGREIDFVEIAGIAYGDNFYVILQPVELLDGMDEDEAIVFKATHHENGDDEFEIETSDDIVDAVLGEYNRLLDEQG